MNSRIIFLLLILVVGFPVWGIDTGYGTPMSDISHAQGQSFSQSEEAQLAQNAPKRKKKKRKKRKKRRKKRLNKNGNVNEMNSGQAGENSQDGMAFSGEERNVVDDTSAGNRDGKSFSVHFTAAPLTLPVPTMYGGSFSYLFDRDMQLEGSFYYASVPVFEVDVVSMHILAGMRYFLGNSFNLGLAFGYRDLALEYAGSDSDSVASISFPSYGIDLKVGNRWQWESVSFGVDWLGYFHSFAEVNEVEEDDTLEEALEKTIEAVAAIPTVYLFKFDIGVSF